MSIVVDAAAAVIINAVVAITAVIHIAWCVTVNAVGAVVNILIAVIYTGGCHIGNCGSQFCIAAIMLATIIIAIVLQIISYYRILIGLLGALHYIFWWAYTFIGITFDAAVQLIL